MTDKSVPLYVKIFDDYKRQIINGVLKEDEKIPSEIELAERYKVSRITSKRALEELERDGFIYRIKGSGSYVSRYNDNINQLDYKKPRVVNFVLPFDSTHGGLINMINTANEYLQGKGFLLQLQNSTNDTNKEKDILLDLYYKNTDGIIYYPSSSKHNIDIINMMVFNDYPIVIVDKYFERIEADYVISDNFSGAYKAVSYLVKMGHKNIGYISYAGLDFASSARDRFLGYCQALKDNNLELKYGNYILDYIDDIKCNFPEIYDTVMKCGPLSQEVLEYFKRMLNRLLDREDRITAIHTVNDYLALSVFKAAVEMGVKIPEELSLIGFDNIEISQHLGVPLTTVEQDLKGMGLKAAEILNTKISTNNNKTHKKVVIPTRLIERLSVLDLNKQR